ncbi:MAG: tetratricopeptide repeat protein [Candidatus Wallbacteria bacterium]|nr:tetratricopeptide repeat protein [Candidatus Wallbacteria bacterium]
MRERSAVAGKAWLALVFALALATPAEANLEEARAYFRLGKFQKALEVIEQVSPPPPELLLIKADCLQQLERFSEALTVLRDLIRKFPTNAHAVRARQKELELLERMRDFPALVTALEAAFAADGQPDSPFLKDLALAHVRAGHPQKAIELLEKHPTTRNLNLLCGILKDSGLLASFLTDREKAFDGELQRARILGELFAAAQDPAKAKKYLELAAPVEETLLRLAEVSKALKDLPGQIACYEKLIALAKKGPYYEKLGELYLARGETPRAHATWRGLLASQGDTPETYTWLARVFLDHGFKTEALEVLMQGRLKLADPNLFRKEAAECHAALANFQQACAEYLELAPSGFDAVKAPLIALAGTSEEAFKACAATLTAAVTATPRLPEYYFLAIEVLRVRGYGPEIQALVDRLCDTFESIPRELLGFGLELQSAGRLEEALRVYGRLAAVAREADLWDTLLAQASALRAWGKQADALSSLDRLKSAGAIAAFLTRAESLRGEILLYDLRRFSDARIVFESLVAANPAAIDRPLWMLSSARAAMGTLDYTSARRLLESLAENARVDVRLPSVFLLGYLARLDGRFDDALERFTSITMEDTASTVANDALASILFLTTHPVPKDDQPLLRAYFQLEHFLELGLLDRYEQAAAAVDPSKIPPALAADFLYLQGRAFRMQGKPEDSARSYELLLQKFADSPRAPEAMLTLAELFEGELKHPEKASKVLKDYLLANPSSLRLEEVRGRIEKLDKPRS